MLVARAGSDSSTESTLRSDFISSLANLNQLVAAQSVRITAETTQGKRLKISPSALKDRVERTELCRLEAWIRERRDAAVEL